MSVFGYLPIIRSDVRMAIFRLFSRRAHIEQIGHSMIDSHTEIEVGRDACFSIGNGLHTRAGCVLAVRDNAVLSIGNGCFINHNTIIMSRKSITIEDGVTVGPNVCIYDHDHDLQNRGGYILDSVMVKKNAWIGAGVIILKGVTIGENAVVASGCVVTKDVPDNTILIQKRLSTYKNR